MTAQTLTTTLLHFLWQGAAVGVLFAIALVTLRKSSANLRYVAGCVALALLAVAPLATAWVLYRASLGSSVTEAPVSSLGTNLLSGISDSVAPALLDRTQEWILPAWFAGVLIFALRLAWASGHASSLRRNGVEADTLLQS